MAGIRIWPEDMHMGTFYGWIKPVVNLSHENHVSIMLADAQSLENFSSYEACYKATQRLKDILQQFIPNAAILIETEQPSFESYTTQAMTLFTPSYYKRLETFKNTMQSGEDIAFLKAIYPCMMVANIIELAPDYVLAKSGDQSPHIDVINDVIKKGAKSYGWPKFKVGVLGKQHIYVPNLTGKTHMRRSDSKSCVTTAPNTQAECLQAALNHAQTPGLQGPEGLEKCGVIAPMWKAVTGEEEPERLKTCFARHTTCEECVGALAQKIHVDLRIQGKNLDI